MGFKNLTLGPQTKLHMYVHFLNEILTVTLGTFRDIYRLVLALEQLTVQPALLSWPGLRQHSHDLSLPDPTPVSVNSENHSTEPSSHHKDFIPPFLLPFHISLTVDELCYVIK